MYKPPSPQMAGKCQLLLIFAFCISCRHMDEQPVAAPPETPKALQDKSSLEDVRLISKSSKQEDMVGRLYHELVQKDSALVELEARLNGLPDKTSDSTRLFNTFDEKNEDYYGSAHGHVSEIKDSSLRKRMEALIAESDTAYRGMTVRHRQLLAGIDGKRLSMADLHIVLMLTRTLPVMEQYQQGHLPGTTALQHIFEEYEGMVRREDGLIKK